MKTWKMDDFLQKLKKVVRIVLYGPAISQSDCRKAGPYQLAYNNRLDTDTWHFMIIITPAEESAHVKKRAGKGLENLAFSAAECRFGKWVLYSDKIYKYINQLGWDQALQHPR